LAKVAVVTDSTATIPAELVRKYQINVAPQVLIWGKDMYEDGVNIQPEEFYNRLAKSTTMPTTSQVTPASFNKVYSRLLESGYDILSVLISEKLSGTIASANQVKELMPQANIEIVDSRTTAMAMGFAVLEAAKAAAAGAGLAECKAVAERARECTGLFVTVDTLEFLHRGGRIGGGARFLASALNIKPILELRDGRLEGIERVRTRRKALGRLVELAVESIGERRPVHLASLHANAPEDARYLLDQVNGSLNCAETLFTEVSPVIGTHAGPGTVGLCYMAGYSS
jgi:DegV family protein with EDD domain